jgi:hypothetical protein
MSMARPSGAGALNDKAPDIVEMSGASEADSECALSLLTSARVFSF